MAGELTKAQAAWPGGDMLSGKVIHEEIPAKSCVRRTRILFSTIFILKHPHISHYTHETQIPEFCSRR